MKYAFIPNFWEYLDVFHQFLVGELRKIQQGDLGRFTYLSSVRVEDRPQFETILKRLILNMQVRFFRPSLSLDKRSFKAFLDYDQLTIRSEAPIVDCSRCGLTTHFDLFNLRLSRPEVQNLSRLLGLDLDVDMERIVPLLRFNRDLIQTKIDERSEGRTVLEKKMRRIMDFLITANIMDVLRTTPNSHLSRLWHFLVRLLTIMSTTVECE